MMRGGGDVGKSFEDKGFEGKGGKSEKNEAYNLV